MQQSDARSHLVWLKRLIMSGVLVFAGANPALAQTITVNGSSSAIEINRGVTIGVATGGGSAARDWVGLYTAGAPNGSYLEWWYLNGTHGAPGSPVASYTHQLPMNRVPGNYELRYFANDGYSLLGQSGVVTVKGPQLTVNGVAGPQTVSAEPGGSIQVEVVSSQGSNPATDWVGVYRIGAPATAWLDWVYLSGTRETPPTGTHSANFAMTLPNARGPYELRLFYSSGYDVVATGPTIHSEVRTRASGGDAHTLVARPDGSVWASGRNAAGELGDDSTNDSTTPIHVAGLSNVVSVAAGASHSMALTATGSVYVWGGNDAGQVGDGTNTPRLTPTLLSLTDVVAIAAGDHHSVALTASGQVFTWGLNGSGALGDGTTTNSNVPIQVSTGALAIAAGDHFTLFVKTDRTVWGMGANQDGTLGDGSYTNRTSPVQMIGASSAVAVSGGRRHALVLRSDGTVLATGRNDLGQMGDNTINDRWSAAVVPTLTNIVGIAAGKDFSVALDKDGVVRGWGDNGVGQLGASTPSYRTAAATITGLSGTKFIAVGKSHVIALDTNNAVMTFGENTAGGLGDGTTNNRATPEPSYGFSGRVATPTFSVTSGTYGSDFNVVVSNATDGSTMRYTQNGSEPTASDPTVASGSSIAIAQSQTLKVKAWKTGTPTSDVGSVAYEMKVATPSLSPGAGTFASPTSVTLATATSGAVVRYTLDGSNPTLSSAQYTSPVAVDHTSTLKAAGFKSNWSDSNVNTGTYTMNFGTLAAPTVEPAAGTYTSAGTVTMSSTQEGATIRFTTNGETPTASSAAYTSPLSLDGSMTVKAKAFHPDYTTSAETGRVYTLAAAAPTISPSTGVYTIAQDVTITAASGPSVTVRYTVDGSDPTETSTPYTATFSVETGTTVKARSFPSNGWAASAAASAALSFNYGTLATPTASPDGGVYADAQSVTLSGPSGAIIRYTTDGNEPTAVSNLYVAPLQAGTVTVKARAYHPDWTTSDVMTENFTIDTQAPSIVGRRFPSAFNGWHLTPVTVTFLCTDNSTVASCSSPATVSVEGIGQTATGTAVDTAGRETTIVETFNLDLTPPVVTLTSPADALVTTSDTVTITGTAADALSGLASVMCNGVATSVVDGQVSCTVGLRPGRNTVAVSARDIAGHSASAAISISRVGTAPSALTLTPNARTMVVGEQMPLALRDVFGSAILGATWSSTDAAVLSLSTDDPPMLTAVAPGNVIVSAEKDGFDASSVITVIDTEISVGQLKWSAAMPSSPNQVEEAPIYAHPIGAMGPDVFTVAKDTATGEWTVWPVTIATGEAHAMIAAPGEPLMGDSFGGLVAGTRPPVGERCDGLPHGPQVPDGGAPCYKALVRFAGPADTVSWRYESRGVLDRPAQTPDGTIYVLEHAEGAAFNRDKAVVVLDGATGIVKTRVPLANFTGKDISNFGCMNGAHTEVAPHTSGPIGGGDGFGYLMVSRHHMQREFTCSSSEPFAWYAYVGTTYDNTIQLLRLSQDGIVNEHVLDSGHHFDDPQTQDDNWFAPQLSQVVPDGIRGVVGLASLALTGSRVFRLDDEGIVANNPWDHGGIELIGQNGTVYANKVNQSGQSLAKNVVDIRTRQIKWTLPVEWSWLAASPDGGAMVENLNTQVASFDGSGQLQSTSASMGLTNPVQLYGSLVGNSSVSGVRAVSMFFEDATHFDATRRLASLSSDPPRRFGNRSNQTAPPPTFPTIQQAAVEQLRFYNGRSIDLDREFGGSICRNPQQRFIATFSEPSQPPNSDFVFATGCETLLGLSGLELAGRYHTHGKFGNVGLSFGDVINAQNNPTTPWFVASPCGGIYEYSAYTTPRPWYRWKTSTSDLFPIYGKPLPQRATGRQPCPVDVGIVYP